LSYEGCHCESERKGKRVSQDLLALVNLLQFNASLPPCDANIAAEGGVAFDGFCEILLSGFADYRGHVLIWI